MSDDRPCGLCGKPVRIDQVARPRKMAEREQSFGEQRVCTNPKCSGHIEGRGHLV
ncbi:hypothetical protein FHU40_001001 [Nocardioides soli]|uniref:Uncharacterized protein n=1 Tax=Nocardioides soli TaxID=1036020 RepID=A0A7W4VSX2_9ACTN|nr:hypothetical protein [Nocardioides soli]